MLNISSYMCGQANLGTSYSPGSILFFSYMCTVWYVNFRTTKKSIISKRLLSLYKNEIHKGYNIQREYNNSSSEYKKINLLSLIKAMLISLPPSVYRRRSHKNIFTNL